MCAPMAALGAVLMLAASASASGCGSSGGRCGTPSPSCGPPARAGYGSVNTGYSSVGSGYRSGSIEVWGGRSGRPYNGCNVNRRPTGWNDGNHGRPGHGARRGYGAARGRDGGVRVDVRIDDNDRRRAGRTRKNDTNHHAYRLTHFDSRPAKARAWGLKPDSTQKKIDKIEKKQRKLEKKQRKLERKREKRRHK